MSPICWETELAPYEELVKCTRSHVCGECGAELVIAWDSKANSRVLKCGANGEQHKTMADKNRIPPNLRTEVARGMTTELTKYSKQQMLQRIDSFKPEIKWMRDLTPSMLDMLAMEASARGLDPATGELTVYQGGLFVGINGRLRKAQETGELDGMDMRPGTEEEKKARRLVPEDYLSCVQVWKKGSTHPFQAWGVVHQWEIDKSVASCNEHNTDPRALPIVKDPQGHADKRGKAAALKEAFHLDLPSVEDLPGGGPDMSSKPYVNSTAREVKPEGTAADPGKCPVHHKQFRVGNDGTYYCPTKDKESGKWCKQKPAPAPTAASAESEDGRVVEEGVFSESGESSSSLPERAKMKKPEEITDWGPLYETCMKQWPSLFKGPSDVLREAGFASQKDATDTPRRIYETILSQHSK
jgi:hypothetical protein